MTARSARSACSPSSASVARRASRIRLRSSAARRSRWRRRWAVLLGSRVDDCVHDDDTHELEGPRLLGNLVEDGYVLAGEDVEHARALVSAAAAAAPEHLGSAYYLGRDLLDLGDVHL